MIMVINNIDYAVTSGENEVELDEFGIFDAVFYVPSQDKISGLMGTSIWKEEVLNHGEIVVNSNSHNYFLNS